MDESLSYQELQNRYIALKKEFREYREMIEAWHESKKRFYSLSNRTQDGIYNFNLSINKYVYTNPSFIKMFGHPCKDIVTTDSVMERIHPEDRQKLKRRIESSLSDNRDGDESEYRCVTSDGVLRWMHDRWIVLRNDKDVPTAIEGIVRDITEMKDIISIKNYLESLLESCMDAIVVTNEAGVITYINAGAEELLQTRHDALVGMLISDVMKHGSSGDTDTFQFTLDHTPTSNYEFEAQRPDGSTVPLLISSAFLKDQEGRTTGTISYMRDISVRKQAEEQIRMLSQQLLRAQELERNSIARDLHDHLAQKLYSLNIQLSTFCRDLPIPRRELEPQVKVLSDSLHTIMDDVRKMVLNIHPTSMDTLGLTRTIHNLCKNVAQICGVEIDFKAAGIEPLKLDFDAKIALYRLIQEGLNNIVKHSEATYALIRLVYSYPHLILRIEDNGKGFDPESLTRGTSMGSCMGIWSMKERVALLNGTMNIRSNRAQGTQIHIEVPHYPPVEKAGFRQVGEKR